MRTTTVAFIGAALLLAVAWAANVDGCTIGVADGTVTSDGRGLLWKSAMAPTVGEVYPLMHGTGDTYDYICFGSTTFEGLNSAGLSTGNAWAGSGDYSGNDHFMNRCLETCGTVDEVRDYINFRKNYGTLNNVTGCFPFLDANGQATMFEIDNNNTVYEYSTQNPNRVAQNLSGRVVRANEFHARTDGTDQPWLYSTTSRYYSGNVNTTGLITTAGDLCARTVVQGKFFHGSGYEFLRHGPNCELATIAADTVAYSIAVHGVAPGESAALATMWAMPGQANYTIAVPMWVAVSDLPACLASGDLAARAMSLRAKGNEGIIADSTLPFEAHLFSEVEQLLAFWRSFGGRPRPGTMTQIEHRMAEDAYSLLDCLDNTLDNNKAPSVALQAERNSGRTLDFTAGVDDVDGFICSYAWDFGDWSTSDQPSPSHTYDHPGWHLVSCTVTDDDGVSNTDWEYVYVVPEPATLSLLAIGGLTTILIGILKGRNVADR